MNDVPRNEKRGCQQTVCRLHEDIMFGAPERNFNLWDTTEVEVLESYAVQFKSKEVEGHKNANFMKNWANVITAIDYCYGTLATTYIPFERLPLKEAIATGMAFKNLSLSTCTESDVKKLQACHTDVPHPRAIDFVSKEVLACFPLGEHVRMTPCEYFNLVNSKDVRIRNAIREKPELVSLVAIRRNLARVPEMIPARRKTSKLTAKSSAKTHNHNNKHNIEVKKNKETT